jgi:hypothetical protein
MDRLASVEAPSGDRHRAQQRQDSKGIPKYLRPFLPYVDKRRDAHSIETFASSEPHKISLHTIKFWLRICDGSHKNHCLPDSLALSPGPQWLVDIQNNCIVPSQGKQRYVALSYVRGKPGSLCALLSNTHELQLQGSLLEAKLPRTIRDAMKLVSALGERYMWVDRLCIIQDDEVMKASQLRIMGAIYARAYFTIVAAQGRNDIHPLHNGLFTNDSFLEDVSCGCKRSIVDPSALRARGPLHCKSSSQTNQVKRQGGKFFGDVGGLDITHPIIVSNSSNGCSFVVPRPCHHNQPTSESDAGSVDAACTRQQSAMTKYCHHQAEKWKLWTVDQHGTHDTIMEEQYSRLQETKWYSRGWTFQEYLLSRRRLIFHGNTVNWECHCASWHENQRLISPESCSTPLPHTDFGLIVEPWPNFHRYGRVASMFSLRDLTYDEDVLDAFSGVLDAFGRVFKGGFISGLPQMLFDAALLWQPYSPMRRRMPSSNTAKTTGVVVLPSWSWVGWQGELNSESWRSGCSYIRQHNQDNPMDNDAELEDTQPSSWVTTSTVEWHHHSNPADKDWGRWTLIEGLSASALDEDGWTEHTCFQTHHPYFTHRCDPLQGFWHPIPLLLQSDSSPFTNVGAPFIRTRRTTRAELQISSFFLNKKASMCCTAVLSTQDHNWAGVLRLNNQLEENSILKGEVCDLLEISAGSVRDQESDAVSFDEWFLEECPRRSGHYDFINVLWVEWTAGIAYRKAAGRVGKTIWDTVAREVEDVVIG